MMEVTSAQIITDAHDRALRFRGRETHPFFSRDAMIMFRSHVHEGVAYKELGEYEDSYAFITRLPYLACDAPAHRMFSNNSCTAICVRMDSSSNKLH